MKQPSVTLLNISSNELKVLWEKLYEKAEPNFFLSWNWIGVWLSKLKSPPLVCCAKFGNDIVGLAIFTQKRYLKRGILPTKQLLLHRTGEHTSDQVWIEYNDFLVNKAFENAIRIAMVDFVCSQLKWDELVIGATSLEKLTSFRFANLIRHDSWHSHSYVTDLKHLRETKTDYLSSLSKNTRYQINRSIKAYEEYGEIQLSFANSKEQAVSWFKEAAPLHIKRWENTNVGSGYSNPKFVDFHESLISNAFAQRKVDLIKLSAGDMTICYMYNFIENKDVKFYLAATNFEPQNKKLKPGLISHYLCINAYLEMGYDTYDFMAGEFQYKRSLSSSTTQICIAHFQKRSFLSLLEQKLRLHKRKTKPVVYDEQALKPLSLIISGGTACENSNINYDQARLIEISMKNSEVTLTAEYNHEFKKGEIGADTDRIFKSASETENGILVVSETQVVELSKPPFKLLESYSDPSFNDLHHAIQHKDGFMIANTGLDCLSYYNKSDASVTHYPTTLASGINRIKPNIDYRQIRTTKPHFTHPNFVFQLNDEVWVTRCDTMDAISIENPSKRINLNHDLVHDGVIHKNLIYFTFIDGHICVYNSDTLKLKHSLSLSEFVPGPLGWCRGILPLSANIVCIGVSKTRQSKRITGPGEHNFARVLIVDIFKRSLLSDINISQFGIDAVFSILESKP